MFTFAMQKNGKIKYLKKILFFFADKNKVYKFANRYKS